MKYLVVVLLSFVLSIQYINGTQPYQSDTLAAQAQKNFPLIETRVHVGKIVKNYRKMPATGPAIFSEINLAVQTSGKQDWHQVFGLPQVGLSLFYNYLGNNDVFGQGIGMVPNMTFNTIKRERWNLKITLGTGFAYFAMPYDTFSNPENQLIGSHVTNMSFAALSFYYHLTKRLVFTYGISTLHASNGHYQLPNVGMNAPALHVGIKYLASGHPVNFTRRKVFIPKGKLKYNIRIGTGMHEFGYTFGPAYKHRKYLVYTSSVFLSKRYGKFSNVHMGLAGKYYTNFYDYISEKNYYDDHHHLKSCVFTYFLAHEFLIHRFSLITQGGIDFYNPFFKEWDKLHNIEHTVFRFLETYTSSRLAVQYYFFDNDFGNSNNMYIGLYIKANFGEADFFGSYLGFRF